MLSVACVGVAGHGWNNLNSASQHARIAAICDVDDVALAAAATRFPDAARFSSIGGLFSSDPRRFDAVIVTIPDHTHVNAVQAALDSGVPVYCEKPLSNSIPQLDLVEQRLRSTPVVTALGCQGVYTQRFEALVDVIRSRFSGRPVEITAWTDRPGGWWEPGAERLATAARSPDQIRWSEWLGNERSPAQFDRGLHPGAWRHSLVHGTGALGDMGPHLLALPFVALDLAQATLEDVEVMTSSRSSSRRFPEAAQVRFRLRAGENSDVVLTWYHGVPPPIEIQGVDVANNGCLVESGKQGVAVFDWLASEALALSAGDAEPIDLPALEEASSIGIWLQAVATADRTPTDFSTFGIPLTRLVLAGCDAMRH